MLYIVGLEYITSLVLSMYYIWIVYGLWAGTTIDVKNYVISINIPVAISHYSFESNGRLADSK